MPHCNRKHRDRNADSQPFMSSKTLRKFWASHRLIQFREVCHWCGESPKVLPDDETKTRVSMQKIRIVPTKSASKDEVIQTIHRKFVRCVLAYPSNLGSTLTEEKKLEKNIRNGRKHEVNHVFPQ